MICEIIFNNPVLLSFLMFMLWLLLPMIPSIIIYKIFPSDKVGISGILANLKINATGAFAAYLIMVVVAAVYWLGNVQSLIPNSSYQTWEVTAFLKYYDTEGRLLKNQDKLIDQTDIQVVPFIEEKTPRKIKFITTGQGRRINITFSSQDTGFNNAPLDLQTDNLKVDDYRITVLDTLKISQIGPDKILSSDQGLMETNAGPPRR